MATVNLIYFGSVMDITGTNSETIDAPATLNELNAWLISRYPGLSVISYRLSVNRQLITDNRQLVNGDEIALLPPFAGG
ncbi:MAG: MoaD/ThiS family protein [Porphyromonadaceae bacterium]|nr:MAG: MoaD/ThiS family protein [Porphyromonadaceae bacterium]